MLINGIVVAYSMLTSQKVLIADMILNSMVKVKHFCNFLLM